MNTSYNLECKFTLQQITPATYVSPSHISSAVTTIKMKSVGDYKINIQIITWQFYDSVTRGNFRINLINKSDLDTNTSYLKGEREEFRQVQ